MARSQPRIRIPARIAGSGAAIPARVVTNAELSRTVDTSDAWIVQRTGIRQRYIIGEGQSLLSLSVEAGRQALQSAQLAPGDLGMAIVATMSPQMLTPSTAARLVDQLGATPAGAVDIGAACSGFVYALNMAAGLIATGAMNNILVVGAEVLSQTVDWSDRRTCVLFGDGAAAVVLSADSSPNQGCIHQSMYSNGAGWRDLYCPRTNQDIPENDAIFSGKLNTLQMNGREIYRFAVSTLEQTILDAVEAAGVELDQLKAILVHQSNARIIEGAARRLGLTDDRIYVNIDRFGNTAAASVPLCFHELRCAGRLVEGDLVLFVALGGGLTWATSLWRL
ncbi:MAG: ketoacyl-ACP synthase III [Phycisphaeraceae bacterium]|nr:ketoacyl-ACP synthase III [Phycisphaeraceae bacterium]